MAEMNHDTHFTLYTKWIKCIVDLHINVWKWIIDLKLFLEEKKIEYLHDFGVGVFLQEYKNILNHKRKDWYVELIEL